MTANRQPNQADLLVLAQALSAFRVDYVLIGGAAMAVHGFPRMTKDIDLLLPVDPVNNERLLRALESMPETKGALATLRPEWMDKGFSTALEGEIYVDLLYVAASKSFDDLRKHIQTLMFNGVPVVTLDVDGMLMTKQTPRESDVPDRLKLERLRNAQHALEKNKRIANLPNLENSTDALHILWELATAAIEQAGGNAEKVQWKQVETAAIKKCLGELALPPESVAEALNRYSPGAVSAARQAAIYQEIRQKTPK